MVAGGVEVGSVVAVAVVVNPGFKAGLERAESEKLRARIAELERVLDRVSLYASQLLIRWDLHGLGRGDERLIENFRAANKEIKSVLGKGE